MNYSERILYIASILLAKAVPFTINDIFDGMQLRFPWTHGDIACHYFTYGAASGAVESYCFPWDEGDVTVLTPDEAAEKIIEYFEQKRAS